MAAFLGMMVFGAGAAHADAVCYNTGIAGDGHSAWTTCNYVNNRPKYYIVMKACGPGSCSDQASNVVNVGQQAVIHSSGYLAGNMTIIAVW